MLRKATAFLFVILTFSWAAAQEYQPKFKGDPAKSDSEAAALGFMRTVVSAERIYHNRHHAYTTSLQELAGTGSITRRSVGSNKRGNYTVHYRGTAGKYELSMTPDQMDATHRSFFVDQNGKIKADDSKPATEDSPEV
jgi:hypothetical protein